MKYFPLLFEQKGNAVTQYGKGVLGRILTTNLFLRCIKNEVFMGNSLVHELVVSSSSASASSTVLIRPVTFNNQTASANR